MKTILTTLTAILIVATSFAGNGDNANLDLKVNAKESTIFWTGKKVTGEHTGTLKFSEGNVIIENGVPSKVNLTLDMKTITVTDIEDPEYNAKLTGHLNSPDFFSTEAHSEGTFETTSITPISGAKDREANYTVKGNLILKGITHEIEFPAFVAIKNKMMVANGKITIDRSKWDIRYGSDSFFDGLGDKMIYDAIEMNFVLSAKV